MRQEINPNKAFPLSEAVSLIKDLVKPNPWIYWCDFLFHISLTWATFAGAIISEPFSRLQILCFICYVFALYRSVIFTHELAHLKKSRFKTLFTWIWNLTCGFPFCVPAYYYNPVHLEHHKRNIYGTSQDGEYLPLSQESPWQIIAFLLINIILPFAFILRALITPFSFLHPTIRKWIWQYASSMVIDLKYQRPLPSKKDKNSVLIQEWLTFIYASLFLFLLFFLPKQTFIIWYGAAVAVFFLNAIRTLAAHAYRNKEEKPMNVADQFLDSIDIKGSFFTTLWAPVGLRYHATHHLFPYIPYHNLGKARRRLETKLKHPLYQKVLLPSLIAALKRIFCEAWQNYYREKKSSLNYT